MLSASSSCAKSGITISSAASSSSVGTLKSGVVSPDSGSLYKFFGVRFNVLVAGGVCPPLGLPAVGLDLKLLSRIPLLFDLNSGLDGSSLIVFGIAKLGVEAGSGCWYSRRRSCGRDESRSLSIYKYC